MKRIEILDYARLGAGLAVMFFHYTYSGIENGKIHSITHEESLTPFTRYGHLGVPFFFMISGYVIFFSAKSRNASRFASSRIKRLYPAYWAGIIFTSSVAFFLGGNSMSVTPAMIASNFTMFQNYLGFENVDGVYWTLFFEVRFYLSVFIILFFGFSNRLSMLFSIWPIAISLTEIPWISNPGLLFSHYYYYFAAGGLFAILSEKRSVLPIVSLALAFIMCLWKTSESFSDLPTVIIVSSFYIFFTACNLPSIRKLKLPFSRFCGAITYPLYLIHAHFGYMMINKFANDQNKWVVYSLVVIAVFSIAWTINFFIENRMAKLWDRLFVSIVENPIKYAGNQFILISNRVANTCLRSR